MALRNEEIVRLKRELGYNITGVGADVYIQYSAVFDRAVQPYLVDPATTSSTAVLAVTGGTRVAITLADNPTVSPNSTQTLAFVVGSNVVVDVGSRLETSIVEAVSGLSITLKLENAHSGTYPVLVQGAEQWIRDCFDRIDVIQAQLKDVAPLTAGLAALTGEVEFFGGGHGRGKGGGRNKFEDLMFQRRAARLDLAAALGIPYIGDTVAGTGNSVFEPY